MLYADPAGLSFRFDTIRFFAERYDHLDLLINLPLPGFVRALRAGHQNKAGHVLDVDEPLSLIGRTSARTDVTMREYAASRLRVLGYKHFASESIRNSKNSAIYDLDFPRLLTRPPNYVADTAANHATERSTLHCSSMCGSGWD
jgi:hypothetical protein